MGARIQTVSKTHIHRGRGDHHRQFRREACLGVELEVIDVDIEFIGAVEVAHGDVTSLAGVGTQIHAELIPVARITVATGAMASLGAALG